MGNSQSRKPPDPYSFYWSGKKKLFPDWEAVKRVDELVAQTPAYLRGEPNKLVPYLISECRTEAEKFRAIFRWVCDNIKYDVNALNQGYARSYSLNRTLGANSVEQVLKTGVAVCAGYVNLIADLCEKAGIEVTYIGGMVKADTYSPGEKIDLDRDQGHAWIAVKLGEKTYLCDPTWAAGSTDGTEGGKKFKRTFDETWFITEPVQFLETHWPRGVGNVGARGDVLPELQYVDKPMTDFDDWCSLPIRRGSCGRYPLLLTPVSHKNGIIETSNNTAVITFKYDRCPLLVQTRMTSLSSKKELEGFALVEKAGSSTYRVHVRLPATVGSGYLLDILTKPFYTSVNEVLTYAMRYRLLSSGDTCRAPFPGDVNAQFIGPTQNFYDCGFETKSKCELRSKDGTARLRYLWPKSIKKRQAIIGKLVFGNETTKLTKEFSIGSVDREIHADLTMRRQGEYLFSLWVQSPDDTKTYYPICSHVIVCEKAYSSLDALPQHELPYGTTTFFHSNGYKLHSPKSYLLTTTDGHGAIDLTIPNDRSVAFCLQKDSHKYRFSDESIYAEWRHGRVRIHVQPPESGYYLFVMNEWNNGSAGERLAFFLIHCSAGHEGPSYPKLQAIWGPKKEFETSGCRLIGQKTSTIRTKKGYCRLTIKNTYKLSQLHFQVTDTKGTVQDGCALAESKDDSLTFHFRFKEEGNYRFALHLLSERGTFKANLLNILVQAVDTCEDLFCPHPMLVGEYEKLRELNLRVTSSKKAIIRTNTGKCQVVLQGKMPVELLHELKFGNDVLNEYVYCETNGQQSQPEFKYTFDLPKVGMYYFLVHDKKQKGGQVYSVVIECTKVGVKCLPFFTAKPINFPVGMEHGNKAEVELSHAQSSTIRLVNGLAKLLFKIGNADVEKLMAWFHTAENEDRRRLGHHVMVQRTGPRAEVTVAPPEPKRYLLALAAKMKGSEDLVKVGTFLIEAGDKVRKYNGFPVRYSPFFATEGCRFFGPFRTTLERERTYDFSICIPGATKVVVGGTVLSSRTRSGAHKGKVKVKPADKTLTVSAIFKSKAKEDVVNYLQFEVANKSKEQFVTS